MEIYTVVSNIDRLKNIFAEAVKMLAKGPINITIEPIKKLKTKKQLGYFFGIICTNLQAWFLDEQGEHWSINDLKDMLYLTVGEFEKKTYPNGVEFVRPLTLSKMTKEQAADFITKVINYIDNQTDIVLSPDARYCWVWSLTDHDLKDLRQDLPYTDKAYLSSLGKSFCVGCGVFGCVAHHFRMGKYAGVAKKSPDWLALPLCPVCHEKIHRNEKEFLDSINYIKGGLSWAMFCRVCYERWAYGF